jgi:hypothetical protein
MFSLRAKLVAAALVGTLLAATAAAKDPKGFVVHEWGTFSTFSGSDGAYLKFTPDDRGLPEFVYSRHREVKGGLPDAFVSLETPVTYFYSDRDLTASVSVEFPRGMMTEWYPAPSRPPVQGLRWDNIRITPDGKAALPESGGRGSRYFAARETDSAQVQITTNGKTQNEKFLFYRGVGDFQMPMTIRALGKGEFSVKNTGKEAVPGFFLVRVEAGKVFFEGGAHLSPGQEIKLNESDKASTTEKLGEAVAALLIEQGLYEKEAKAMVKTWSEDWFGDEGTRVLYVVAQPVTDGLLPIKIDPKPDQIVRVLVGRHDLLTPEREKEVDVLVKQLNGASNEGSQAADRLLNKMGRYRWAAQTASQTRLKIRRTPE